MTKLKYYFCLMITLILMMNISAPVRVLAQGSDVGYELVGYEENNGFVMDVYIKNITALAGRIAIAFDPSKVRLSDTSSQAAAVKSPSSVVVSAEGVDSSLLLSNEKGYVMFAWYSASNSGINAASSPVKIATIAFDFAEGAGAEDFTRNTFGMYYVNSTMVDKWQCSLKLVGNDLSNYNNMSLDDDYVCDIGYDYPNCDVIPIVTYEVCINVRNSRGNAVGALVTLDNIKTETDSQGAAVFQMENGVYAYRISATGYAPRSGYIIVRDADVGVFLDLADYADVVDRIASELQIGFGEGDSASSVTTGLSLPVTGEYGEQITWRSNNTDIITSGGVVNAPDADTSVTLTATIRLGSASTTKIFTLTVKGTSVSEEKNETVVRQDAETLDIIYAPGDSASAVTTDLTLTGTGANGSAVIWTSDNEDAATNFGVITRGAADTVVTYTAYIYRGDAHTTKTFTITVLADPSAGTSQTVQRTDSEIVGAVKESLEIGYAKGDSAQSVTSSLTLPTKGTEDTIISWTSSNPAVITAYGGVVRQIEDAAVTLTATIVKGDATATKTFSVLVKASELVPVNPGNGQETDIEEINKTVSGGGSGGTQTNTDASAPAATETPPPNGTQTTDRFTDLGSVPWARTAILSLAERGVISGTGDAIYSPQEPIKRADFVILLVRLLGLEGEKTDEFADVERGAYYYEPVTLAKSLGVISGVGDDKFNPEGSITRQDMITMTYRALESLGMTNGASDDLTRFTDRSDVADYALESVSYMVGTGSINGDDQSRLNPTSNTTRAETAVFLYNLGI